LAEDLKILNLGCGRRPIEGAVNHDITKHAAHVDVAWDLNVIPWPWPAESFDRVVAQSVLEHLTHNVLVSMNEAWRVLVPGGEALIKLPYWKAEITWEDLTHMHRVGLGAMDQLDPTTKRGTQYAFYTPYKWRILKRWHNGNKGRGKKATSLFWRMRKMPLDWDGDRGLSALGPKDEAECQSE
jgi:SAM-dependent methyltransferase